MPTLHYVCKEYEIRQHARTKLHRTVQKETYYIEIMKPNLHTKIIFSRMVLYQRVAITSAWENSPTETDATFTSSPTFQTRHPTNCRTLKAISNAAGSSRKKKSSARRRIRCCDDPHNADHCNHPMSKHRFSRCWLKPHGVSLKLASVKLILATLNHLCSCVCKCLFLQSKYRIRSDAET